MIKILKQYALLSVTIPVALTLTTAVYIFLWFVEILNLPSTLLDIIKQELGNSEQ